MTDKVRQRYSEETKNNIQTALSELASRPPKQRSYTAAELIQFAAPKIEELRRKNYSLSEIAEALHAAGLVVAESTLVRELRKTGKGKPKAPGKKKSRQGGAMPSIADERDQEETPELGSAESLGLS
jgi:predicted transcriptional regulator